MRVADVRICGVRVYDYGRAVIAHAAQQVGQATKQDAEILFESVGGNGEGAQIVAEQDVSGAGDEIVPVGAVGHLEDGTAEAKQFIGELRG